MMTNFSTTLATIFFASLLGVAYGRGAHERFYPYGYLAPSVSSTVAPTPTTSATTTASISVSVSVSVSVATPTASDDGNTFDRRKASSSSSSSAATPTSTSDSGITIVSIPAPASSSDVPYLSSTFFANWHAKNSSSSRTFGLTDLKWDLLDSVTYGYIPIPVSSFSEIALSLDDAQLLPQFVELAHDNNVTAILSFGGHIASPTTGGSASSGFALALATEESRSEFVTGVVGLVKTLGISGVEFDWEWTPCSLDTPYTSKTLSTAFLAFLSELRQTLEDDISISLAVGVVPFETPQLVVANSTSTVDTPVVAAALGGIKTSLTDATVTVANTLTAEYKNVSSFADVVDWITVMNFDLYGAWSQTNPIVLPNSPLNGTCPTTPTQIPSNATTIPFSALPIYANTAVASWTLSGFRPDQIVLGVSSSGRSYRVAKEDAVTDDDSLTLYPPFDSSESNGTSLIKDLGDEWYFNDILPTNASSKPSKSAVTSTSAQCALPTSISTVSGVFTFQGLIDAGFLDDDGDVPQACEDDKDDDDAEILGGWDECSETPFVYNTKTGVMISYDDSESMELKGEFVLKAGLRGFQLYEAGGDSSSATLLTALRHGAGFPDEEDCRADDWDLAHTSDDDDDEFTTEQEWESLLQLSVDALLSSATSNSTSTSTSDDSDDGLWSSSVTSTSTTSTPLPTASSKSNPKKRLLRWERILAQS